MPTEEDCFYIKALYIYNREIKLIKTVLVEQISSEEIASSNLNPYNTSTLINEENLYFYKRIFSQAKAGDEQGKSSEMQLFCLDLHTMI